MVFRKKYYYASKISFLSFGTKTLFQNSVISYHSNEYKINSSRETMLRGLLILEPIGSKQ